MELRHDRLRAIRERRLLTQQQLADKAGTTKTNINRLESGRQRARLSTVRRLADALDVAAEELVDFAHETAAPDEAGAAGSPQPR